MKSQLPNKCVLDAITRKLLSPKAREAIIACARLGFGAARNRQGIVAVARKFGACPRVVLAAFGFLPDANKPRRYVDVLTGYDECTLALLPKGSEVRAAFALSRAVAPEGASFAVE